MIPNVSRGKGITGTLRYVMGEGRDSLTHARRHLEVGQMPRAEILGGQNFGYEINSAERLDLARREMEWNGKAENQTSRTRKCENDCYHASLSWGDGQQPTRAEQIEAAESFLKAVGMAKALAVFVAHHDTDHAHIHIVASRIDFESGKTIMQTNDYQLAHEWARQWELEHGGLLTARGQAAELCDAIRDGAAE